MSLWLIKSNVFMIDEVQGPCDWWSPISLWLKKSNVFVIEELQCPWDWSPMSLLMIWSNIFVIIVAQYFSWLTLPMSLWLNRQAHCFVIVEANVFVIYWAQILYPPRSREYCVEIQTLGHYTMSSENMEFVYFFMLHLVRHKKEYRSIS